MLRVFGAGFKLLLVAVYATFRFLMTIGMSLFFILFTFYPLTVLGMNGILAGIVHVVVVIFVLGIWSNAFEKGLTADKLFFGRFAEEVNK